MLDGAVIGERSIIGAGALVTGGVGPWLPFQMLRIILCSGS